MPKTFKVGEKYVIDNTAVPQPVVGEVYVITNQPGKIIGMKLPYKIVGGCSLDGRLEHGFGVWAHPVDLHTEEAHKSARLAASVPQPVYSEVQEVIFDELTHEVNIIDAKEKLKSIVPAPAPVKVEPPVKVELPVKPEVKPEVKPVAKPVAKPEVKPEVKPAPVVEA